MEEVYSVKGKTPSGIPKAKSIAKQADLEMCNDSFYSPLAKNQG